MKELLEEERERQLNKQEEPGLLKSKTIKELMNKWLEKGSATYRATNRLATKNDFRKSIFYYFIFLVSTNK